MKAASGYGEGAPEILRVETDGAGGSRCRCPCPAGDIVSLSPACAAFDLYPNFEVRGRHYKELINGLD